MKLKRLLLLMALAVSLATYANGMRDADTTRVRNAVTGIAGMLKPLSPTYLDGVVTTSAWRDNWFINISGGTSAFAGKPLGCEDLFGRIKPTIEVSAGKWLTPAIGGRLVFQGLQFRDCQLQNKDYQSVHADFLWNVASHFSKARDQPRWGIIPFVGLGIMNNNDDDCHPFAFSYGVMGRYRLTNRLNLTMELGGTTTFRDFDGLGDSRKIGDNLLSLSAGFSVTLGKTGWRRVVDADPYIRQNEYLMGHTLSLIERNRQQQAQLKDNANIIAELKKILELEGLLDFYNGSFAEQSQENENVKSGYPVNDYSGLNSLRARLRQGAHGNLADTTDKSNSGKHDWRQRYPDSASGNDTWNQYIYDITMNGTCIGSPVYVFFQLGTTDLTDMSQLVNLDEIARIAKKYDLRLRVTGAADSATGNDEINTTLGNSRADYITNQFISRGISVDCISKRSIGGTDQLSPSQANRCTYIELMFPSAF